MGNLSMKWAALLLALLGGTASMHAGWKTVRKKSLDGYGWMFDSSNGTPCPNLTGLTIPSSYTSVGISGATGLTVLKPCPKVSLSKTHGVNIRRTADDKTRKVVVK